MAFPHPLVSTGKASALCPFLAKKYYVPCTFSRTAEPMSEELLEGLCPNILSSLFLAKLIDIY
jgi:hypothetical protein